MTSGEERQPLTFLCSYLCLRCSSIFEAGVRVTTVFLRWNFRSDSKTNIVGVWESARPQLPLLLTANRDTAITSDACVCSLPPFYSHVDICTKWFLVQWSNSANGEYRIGHPTEAKIYFKCIAPQHGVLGSILCFTAQEQVAVTSSSVWVCKP